MNVVEISDAVAALASQPFDAAEFPFQFLQAFDNKETTLKRLRKGETNAADVPGGVLQRNNSHIAISQPGEVSTKLEALRLSPKTQSAKAKFILATDGETLEAEEMASGEVISTPFSDLAEHFGFFLSLAGIATTTELKNHPLDVKATGRINKLRTELLRANPEWGTATRRHDLNCLLARLIFCFFAEDTGIFHEAGENGFTRTVEMMSANDVAVTHTVLETLFLAMRTKMDERAAANLPRWTGAFPYVNGGLFDGSIEVPRFTRAARSYLLSAGTLNWSEINPDIFGSMIQAVAGDDERSEGGVHYTSVPNIKKVLNPLFLDDLNAHLENAGTNPRMLLNLKKRMARIRVFDPACGSGNFLVIAYKEMRRIEAEVNRRRGEPECSSEIPFTNFRGIELHDFPSQIARLSLIIAKYQADKIYMGQKQAVFELLPLSSENWIVCGNALRLDWLKLCPPTGTKSIVSSDDLFDKTPQTDIDFENEGGETYICGNPPYIGFTWQSDEQKADLESVFKRYTKNWKSLDYVSGWFMKAAEYGSKTFAAAAFVSTNSICQGQQVPILWPIIFKTGHEIAFAHTSFKWSNLASHNAGVTVVIIGISNRAENKRKLYSSGDDDITLLQEANNINAYLLIGDNVIVEKSTDTMNGLHVMVRGNMPYDGGNLLMTTEEMKSLSLDDRQQQRFIRRIYGSSEFIRGQVRYCLWIEDKFLDEALSIDSIKQRIESVRTMRLASTDKSANELAKRSHQMRETNVSKKWAIAIPGISSENREYLPCGIVNNRTIVTNKIYALYDAPLWNLALIASCLHWVWISTVCSRLEMRFSYSNTLGWNTFPVPTLTAQNKIDLTRCAENILLARERHFPKTIADLYDPDKMPADLRQAHDENDETLERIYIGRRFKNDTERLQKLFDLYTRMKGEQKNQIKKGRKTKEETTS
jgi:hypothetical protein